MRTVSKSHCKITREVCQFFEAMQHKGVMEMSTFVRQAGREREGRQPISLRIFALSVQWDETSQKTPASFEGHA